MVLYSSVNVYQRVGFKVKLDPADRLQNNLKRLIAVKNFEVTHGKFIERKFCQPYECSSANSWIPQK